MSEYVVKRKKVKLVPTVGSGGEQTVEVPENMSVGEAIGQVFGQKLKGKRIVLQNEKDEPVSTDTKVSDVEEVKITPFTEGGQPQTDAKLRRIFIEAEKLASAHPDLVRHGNKYSCFVYPSKGPKRKITLEVPSDYPFILPNAYVSPFDDLSGITHILSEGNVCYMHAEQWDPNLHTLTYVITQAKRIVHEAVMARYGQ